MGVTFCISSIQFWVPITFHGEAMKKDELSQTEGLFWSSGTEALRTLLHHEHSFDTGPLAMFFVIMTATTCWTYGLGVPSGLFVPFDHIEAVSDKLIDLRPYLSKSYTTMQSDASLYACYNIFRGLGLRHLFIHDEGTGKVSGVVTRK